MKFIDKIDLTVQAGKGGDGLLSFLRTKSNQKGGPDGGNGGGGGDILLEASNNTSNLSKYRVNRLYKAQNGVNGGRNRRQGARGLDLELAVPVGTTIYDNGGVLADLTKKGQKVVVAKGGRGGFGNAHFKSSVRQVPQFAELGEDGEKKQLSLELKMIADVGLVGLPNSGKSTLLSVISNAKPKIANYPFTTLAPNIGVVDYYQKSCLIADIPGLIEGASKGKGLGDEFLRHIERTKIILHLIDASSSDWQKDYETVVKELRTYKIDLTKKQKIVALSKADLMISDTRKELDKFCKKNNLEYDEDLFIFSAISRLNLNQLLRAIFDMLDRPQKQKKFKTKLPIISLDNDINLHSVMLKDGIFVVSGKKIEGFVKRTNFSQPQAVRRLRDILSKLGIEKEIRRKGGDKGSKIKILDKFFEL